MVSLDGKNLIFLTSAPRAGSTLLGAILGNSPGMVCPPEPWIQLLLSLFDSDYPRMDTAFDHDLALSAFNELADANARKRASRAFSLEVYNQILSSYRAKIFIDKTPRYYHILDYLEKTWPEASFIWIRRNPLDVIASCKKTWSIPIKEQIGEIVTPHTFDTTLSFDRLINFYLKPGKKYTIDYESIVADPAVSIQGLCEALGVSFDESMLAYGQNNGLIAEYKNSNFGDKSLLTHSSPHKKSVGKWKRDLTREEVRSILTTLGKYNFTSQGHEHSLLEACHYARILPDDITNEGTWKQKISSGQTLIGKENISVYFSATKTIREQNKELTFLRQLLEKQQKELQSLYAECDRFKNAKNLLTAQLADLRGNFNAVEQDREDRREVIHNQGLRIAAIEKELDGRLKELRDIHQSASSLQDEREILGAKLTDLEKTLDRTEQKLVNQHQVIETQNRCIAELKSQIEDYAKQYHGLQLQHGSLQEANFRLDAQRDALRQENASIKHDRESLLERLVDLEKELQEIRSDLAASQLGLIALLKQREMLEKQPLIRVLKKIHLLNRI